MNKFQKMKQKCGKISAAVVTFMVSVLVTGYAFADSMGSQGDAPYHMYSGHGSWGHHGGMMMGPVIIIGLVVLVVIGVIMLINRSKSVSEPVSTGRIILDERYAKGEIEHDEYEERKRRLGN